MIKIQLHVHADTVESARLMAKLVEEHWNFLNQTLAKNPDTLKKNALTERCRQSIEDLADATHRKAHGLNLTSGKVLIKFLKKILKDDEKVLRQIVNSAPPELFTLVPSIKKMLSDDFLYVKTASGEAQTKAGRYLSEEIFSYRNFRASKQCPKTYREGMNSTLLTCPYCNLNPIVVTDISDCGVGKQDAYLDLDHFFPKVRYPYFVVSFYNLIPCCGDCNEKLKGAKEYGLDTHIHPYVDSFDDFYKFRLNTDDYLSGKITIEGKLREGMRIDKSMEDLELIKRYRANVLQVTSLATYFKSRQHLIEINPKEYIDTFLTHFSFKKHEILHRPQSKLLRDIFSELDTKNALGILGLERTPNT